MKERCAPDFPEIRGIPFFADGGFVSDFDVRPLPVPPPPILKSLATHRGCDFLII